jgi:hypothetical protein
MVSTTATAPANGHRPADLHALSIEQLNALWPNFKLRDLSEAQLDAIWASFEPKMKSGAQLTPLEEAYICWDPEDDILEDAGRLAPLVAHWAHVYESEPKGPPAAILLGHGGPTRALSPVRSACPTCWAIPFASSAI